MIPSPDDYNDWRAFARALIATLQEGDVDPNAPLRGTVIPVTDLPPLPAGYKPVWFNTAEAEMYLANPAYDPPEAPDLFNIDTAQLADVAITVQKIRDGAVENAKIFDGAVGSTKLANLAVLTAHIADANISSAKIMDGAIVTAKIGDAQILSAKIADLQVVEAKIGNLAVNTGKIANLAITSAKIANLAVGAAQIQLLAVGTAQIANLAVSTAKIDDLAVSTAKIALLAVTAAQIADATILNAKIANATILDAKIVSVSAAKLVAGTIIGGDIYAGDTRLALHGAYSGAGKGALVGTFSAGLGGTPAFVLGWIDAATFGFQLRNSSGKILVDHTSTLSLAEIAVEIDAIVSDGIIDTAEKKSLARLDAELRARYAQIRQRAAELNISTTTTNLIAWSDDLNSIAGSSTFTDTGIFTVGYNGELAEYRNMANKFMNWGAAAITAGILYTQSLHIKHNKPNEIHYLMVRRAGGGAVFDSTNQTMIAVTDDWRPLEIAQTALGTSTTGILIDGRDPSLAAMGYPSLPADFAIAVQSAQLEETGAASPPIHTNGSAALSNYLTSPFYYYDLAMRNLSTPFPSLAQAQPFPVINEWWSGLTGGADLGAGWTLTSASRAVQAGGWVRLTDASAAAAGYIETNITVRSPGDTVVKAIVKKDAVPKSTRYALFYVRSTATVCALDTNTGEVWTNGLEAAVVDQGDSWLVWFRVDAATGATVLRVYPAYSSGTLNATASVAPTGSIDIRDIQLYHGLVSNAVRRNSFQAAVEALSIGLSKAQRYISEIDSKRADKLVPAASQVVQYTHAMTTTALPKILTNTIKRAVTDVTASGSFTFTPAGCTVDTVGCATGQVRLTAVSSKSAFIFVQATIEDQHLSGFIPVTMEVGDPPVTGGGGAGVIGFGPVTLDASVSATSGAPAQLFAGYQMETNSSGQARLSIALNYQVGDGASVSCNVSIQFQRSTTGAGSWVNVGTVQTGSTSTGGYMDGNGEWVPGQPGALSYSALLASGSASTTYYYRATIYKTGTPASIGVTGTASGSH